MTDHEEVAALAPTAAAVESSPAVETRRRVSLPSTFIAFKHRNYRLYFFGQSISLTGEWMQNVAQSWLVYQLTGSPLYLGIVSFASSIPTLFLTLWAGVLIDRTPKQRLLILTQSAAMLLAFILAADVFLGWVQWWHIVILAFLLGAVNSFDAPGRQVFVIEMVGREDLTNAIALNSATFNSARIIGPTLAGIALAVVGAAWCFFLNGVSFIAVIIALWLMQVPQTLSARTGVSPVAQIREGLSYIWHNRTLRTLMSLVAVSNVFAFGYSALLPAFAKDVLNEGPAGLGFLSAAVGMGALTGALIVASFGHSGRRGLMLTIGNLLFPCMVILFTLSRFFPLSMFLLFFTGLGFMMQNSTNQTLIQGSVPDELRGRVMSVHFMLFRGLFPFGSLLAGGIAQRFGTPIGAAFGAIIALGVGLFWLWRAPFLRKLT